MFSNLQIIKDRVISGVKVGAVALAAIALEGCQQTFEDDYSHSSSVYGDADSGVWEKIDEAAQGG